MISYQNRVVVVTGGAGGMGRAISQRFAKEGSHVIVADVRTDDGSRLVSELGNHCRYAHLDVTDESCWQAVLQLAERDFGAVAALINCAGVVEYTSIEEQEPEMFRRIVDVNLFGPWLGMHVLGGSLRRSGGGAIVNISSTAGINGKSNLGAYVASKFGLRGLTKTAALEFARDGVRVCSVHPGPTRTDMTANLDLGQVAVQPIPRFGEPDEVAAMVWFIAAEATFSTGSEFIIDGGALVGALPAADLLDSTGD
jgi:3alpha(or 20beta)-hydroxysteroid dehydrogenase